MYLWKTILAKLQTAELRGLDIVEQVLKDEERTQDNERSAVDWHNLAKILLAITLLIFLLIAWRLWR